jgi:hypothetical protein
MPDQVVGPNGEVDAITEGSPVNATLGQLAAEENDPQNVTSVKP